jgi:1-acyl-sn-glycerol-3-phosphate acyltransferase
VENPGNWGQPAETILDFYQKKPLERAIGYPTFNMMQNRLLYDFLFFLRYSVPLTVLNSTTAFASEATKKKAALLNKLVARLHLLVGSFRYFTENEWAFDNSQIQDLFLDLVPQEQTLFPMELSKVYWHDYCLLFSYGLARFVFKEDYVDIEPEGFVMGTDKVLQMDQWEMDQNPLRRYMPNLEWSLRKLKDWVNAPWKVPPTQSDMVTAVLGSDTVRAAIGEEVKNTRNLTLAQANEDAKSVCVRMFGEPFNSKVLTTMGFALRNLWQRLYNVVTVSNEGVSLLQQAASRGPLIYLPTHRSYIDFLMTSFMCYNCDLPLPYIAAGEDFLGIAGVRWMFRKSGAFFIRRNFSQDKVYSSIFQEYVVRLLQNGQSLEFFLEGTRSRSGKLLHPKTGMLGVITKAMIEGLLPDVSLCPIAVNYERTIEGNMYSNELSGNSKIKESLSALLKARSVLKDNFGRISLTISNPRSLRDVCQEFVADMQTIGYCPVPAHPCPYITPPALTAQADFKFDPLTVLQHKRYMDRRIAYGVMKQLTEVSEVMPSNCVAALLLMYRSGVPTTQLQEKTLWLVQEVKRRGGSVRGVYLEKRAHIIDHALEHLGSAVLARGNGVVVPDFTSDPNHILLLGQYRNKLLHLFFLEGVVACALYSFGNRTVSKKALLTEAKFLYCLLYREFIWKANPDVLDNLEDTLETMVTRGILRLLDDEMVELCSAGNVMFSFLCSCFWPFIDCFYVAVLTLFSLHPALSQDEASLMRKTQWMVITLHRDQKVFYDSCSTDTIKQAYVTLFQWGVITADVVDGKRTISLSEAYRAPGQLGVLLDRISGLRKQSSSLPTDRYFMADMPILARL